MLTKLRINKLNKTLSLISKRIDTLKGNLNDEYISYNLKELSKIKTLIDNQKSINKEQYHHISNYLYSLTPYCALQNKKMFDLHCNEAYAELNVLGYSHDPDYENKVYILDTISVIKGNITAIEFFIQRSNFFSGDEKALCDFRIKIGLASTASFVNRLKLILDKAEHLKTYENAIEEVKLAELYIQKITNIINEITNEID